MSLLKVLVTLKVFYDISHLVKLNSSIHNTINFLRENFTGNRICYEVNVVKKMLAE